MIDDRLVTCCDQTLNLPRILALHGGGSNGRIFRAQCRVLERALKPAFRLCFAQAPFPSSPGSDVSTVYKDFGMYRAWLPWGPDDPSRDSKDVVKAIDASIKRAIEVDNNKGATGEFVGLLGFSQGAKICASLLQDAQNGARMTRKAAGFRFAVLLAGRGPLVSLTPEPITTPDSTEAIGNLTATSRLKMTLHLHGTSDPGLELHRQLLHESCDQNSARVMEWEGGHRIPIKTRDVSRLVTEIFQLARDNGVRA